MISLKSFKIKNELGVLETVSPIMSCKIDKENRAISVYLIYSAACDNGHIINEILNRLIKSQHKLATEIDENGIRREIRIFDKSFNKKTCSLDLYMTRQKIDSETNVLEFSNPFVVYERMIEIPFNFSTHQWEEMLKDISFLDYITKFFSIEDKDDQMISDIKKIETKIDSDVTNHLYSVNQADNLKSTNKATKKDKEMLAEWKTSSNHQATVIRYIDEADEFMCGYILIDDPLDPIFKFKDSNNIFCSNILEILTEISNSTFNISSIVYDNNLNTCKIGFSTKNPDVFKYSENIRKDSKTLRWVVKECEAISLNLSYNFDKHSDSLPGILFSAKKELLDNFDIPGQSLNTVRNKALFKFDLADSKKPYDVANKISIHLNYFQSGIREILNSIMTPDFTTSFAYINKRQKYKFVVKVFLKDNTVVNLMVSPFKLDTPVVAKDSQREYLDLGNSMIVNASTGIENIELMIEADVIETAFNNTTYRTNINDKEVLAIYIAYRGLAIHKSELVDRDTCLRLFLDKRNCEEKDMYNLNEFIHSLENNKDYIL